MPVTPRPKTETQENKMERDYANYLKKLKAEKNAIAMYELRRACERVEKGIATPQEKLLVANARERPPK
jgi:hypothetical protein